MRRVTHLPSPDRRETRATAWMMETEGLEGIGGVGMEIDGKGTEEKGIEAKGTEGMGIEGMETEEKGMRSVMKIRI